MEAAEPAIGASLHWNERAPAGTSKLYSRISGRPVPSTLRTSASYPPTDLVTESLPNCPAEQLARGRHKQSLVRRPDREVDGVRVKLEDEIVQRREQRMQTRLTLAERLGCLLWCDGPDRDDLAEALQAVGLGLGAVPGRLQG